MTDNNNNDIFFILKNLWLIIANIIKPTKGVGVTEFKEEDMPMV
tara:strand:+ start:305 stop:436 length:132 start_codon:yes stop_codon:yes gene_type:complete